MSTPSYIKANRTPFPWRLVLLISLLLVLLIGGFFLVRHVLYLRELANESAQVDQYGVPMLLGPVRPDGPFFGEGGLADLSVTDNGWNTNQLPDWHNDLQDRLAVSQGLRERHQEGVVQEATTCSEATQAILSGQFDCVFLDHSLPDGSSLGWLAEAFPTAAASAGLRKCAKQVIPRPLLS